MENLFTYDELEKLDEMLTNLDISDTCDYCGRELFDVEVEICSRFNPMVRFCNELCLEAWEFCGESLGFPIN